ncbi:MAG TPA: DUF927 domain-containing protein [Pyrinomonadaceae bacterium]|jgi:hypothetical protein
MMNEIIPRPASGGQDFDSTHKFLDFLFSEYRTGFAEFRYFSAGTPKVNDNPDYFPLPLDKELIEQQVLTRRSRQMITFGPAPRLRPAKKGKAGTDADVAEIGCLWSDLDYDKTPGGAIEVIRRVKSLALPPSVVVNSGYGRHVYYVLKEPLHDGRLLDWQEMIRALRDTLGGDAVINPSRVMRLPGTLNLKYEQPAPCEIVEEDSSWTRYSLEEMKNFLAAASKITAGADNSSTSHYALPSNQNYPEGEKDAQTVVAAPSIDALRERGVSVKVVEAIITGKHTVRSGTNAGRDDDQSSRDFWIAVTLLKKGFTEEEVKAVFRNHPSGCGSKWNQRGHGEKYLNLTLGKAAAQVEGNRLAKGENAAWSPEAMPANYQLDYDRSVWLVTPSAKEGNEPKWTLVAESLIYIAEIHENIDTSQIAVVIAYDYLGRRRSTKILRSQMCDARSLVSSLSGEGAPVSSNNARLVVSYLTAYERAFAEFIPRKKVTSKFGRGRAGRQFFLPGLSADVEFAPNGPGDAGIYRAYAARRGTLKDWVGVMNDVADAQLLIPQIAIAASFVPPLQRFLQIPNFILNIYGNTSSGKSTTLKLASSVYGNPLDPESVIHQWMNTKVAIEQVAGMCSELPIFLDDAQHCSEELKKTVIYMIANGKGKGRGARGGGIRETMSWQTVALSTSEEPLHEASPHEGARGRLLPVGGLTAPFPANSAAFVQSLERSVALNHGIAGETFIRHLNGWSEKDWMKRQSRYTDLKNELLRNSSSDIVGRVSGYIAAVAVAAEITCPLLGLRFKSDVMSAWLLNHLHEQQNNQNVILLALRALADHYVSNLSLFAGSDTYDRGRGALQGAAKPGEYVGFLRSTVDAVFSKRKWNQTAVLNKMAESGALHATETDRHTKKVSVEGIKYRMVCFKWSSLLPDDNQLPSD